MRKIIGVVVVVLAVGVFAYWLKCQLQINLVKSFSLSQILPVQSLQKSCAVAYASEFAPGKTLVLEKPSDWQKIWMREKDSVSVEFKDAGKIFVSSKSKQDWSLAHDLLVEVQPGDVFGFSSDIVNSAPELTSSASVVLYDKNKQVSKWHYGRKGFSGKGVKQVANEFVVPYGVSFIRFRLTGSGVGNSQFSNVKFYRKERIFLEQNPFVLENTFLKMTFETQESRISVLDKRCARVWKADIEFGVRNIQQNNTQDAQFTLLDWQSLQEYQVEVVLAQDKPEIIFKLNAPPNRRFEGLVFPPSFATSNSALVVAPIAEGMLLNRDAWQEVVPGAVRYKGGWSMPFVGVLDGGAGWMEIFETPFDFELVSVQDRPNLFENRWVVEKNFFGYERNMRYVFFDQPSYVAMAKRYRQWAQEKGLVVTLRNKDKLRNYNIGKLLGAVNVWFWGSDRPHFIKELERLGVKKCLFSTAENRQDIVEADKAGFLSSHYDIYQDVWPPIYHDVTHRHEGWPEDLVLDEQGAPIQGWVIKRGLKEYPGGVVCSIPGLKRAKKVIAEELKTKPYTARFIDTTTSTPWRECFSPKHPTTRREDLENKMNLLALSSIEHGLVTGSEDGVADAVPYCDYFEGMLSIGKGRLPESGRNVAKVEYMPPTENFLKYQVGVNYRIPLWELVFHDCAVATWYWGDSSNRIPELWWRKDLFNILYGTMPLWAIRDWDHWQKLKMRFRDSYQNVCPVFEQTSAKEMLLHRFITEDHLVQETVFDGGLSVVVNFGDSDSVLEKVSIPAHGFVLRDDSKILKQGVCR